MDPRKVETITKWESPTSVHDIQVFIGFANIYKRFIQGYSSIAAPMTALTRKGIKFKWSEACEKAFQCLKKAFTSAPILKYFDLDLKIAVKTDAS